MRQPAKKLRGRASVNYRRTFFKPYRMICSGVGETWSGNHLAGLHSQAVWEIGLWAPSIIEYLMGSPLSCDKSHLLRRHFLHHLPTPHPYPVQHLDITDKIFFGAICASHLPKSASGDKKAMGWLQASADSSLVLDYSCATAFKRCLKGDHKEQRS